MGLAERELVLGHFRHLGAATFLDDLFEELLRENPEDDSLLEQLVTLSEETRDWATAYVHLAELMRRRAGDAKLLPRMARALLQTGKRPEALKIYMDLALEALKENKGESALSYLDSISALEPDNLDVLKKKAEIYIKLNRKQELIRYALEHGIE